MICRSFSDISDDDDPWSPRSSKRSRRKEKNPYSNRGLDKFTMLLADLESRREKIMAQMDQKDISLVRFANSNSHDWVPIIVKTKDPKQAKTDVINAKKQPIQQNSEATRKSPSGSSSAAAAAKKDVSKPTSDSDKAMKKSFSWNLNKSGVSSSTLIWRPCYWPVVVIFILMCLVVFGRSFAIICTSIWWYLVPILKGDDVNMRRSMKKEYVRRLSDKKFGSSGTSLQSKIGVMEISSPRHHEQGRK